MRKTSFITQLTYEMKITHYSVPLWACPEEPNHTQLKWLSNFAVSMDVEILIGLKVFRPLLKNQMFPRHVALVES